MDTWYLIFWASDPLAYYAMGSYPYPSSYMLNGVAELPAYPMAVACSYLATPEMQGAELLSGRTGCTVKAPR